MDINVIPPGKFEINVIPPGNFEINLIPPAISTNMEIGYSKITAGFIDDSLGFLAMFQPIEADIGRIGRASCPRVLKMDLQYTCRRESHAMPTSYTSTVTYIICIYMYMDDYGWSNLFLSLPKKCGYSKLFWGLYLGERSTRTIFGIDTSSLMA